MEREQSLEGPLQACLAPCSSDSIFRDCLGIESSVRVERYSQTLGHTLLFSQLSSES